MPGTGCRSTSDAAERQEEMAAAISIRVQTYRSVEYLHVARQVNPSLGKNPDIGPFAFANICGRGHSAAINPWSTRNCNAARIRHSGGGGPGER